MFGEHISRSRRISSPWSARLSTSASTSASTTAPPTPPSSHPFGASVSANAKGQPMEADQLPALHLLNMAGDDSLSDMSDEADGFFSLDTDVSIDQQLQPHDSPFTSPRDASNAQKPPSIPPWYSERVDPSPRRSSRDHSASPLLNPAVRRASETVTYSSSPLQHVGLGPIMAMTSRNSPATKAANAGGPAAKAAPDAQNGSSPSSFGPIAPEVDQKGNLEYKLKILPPSRERFDRLVTQLKWRLLEGGGLAVYEIGVLDDGTLIGLDPDSMKDSLKLLSLMAAELGARCQVQRVLALEKVKQTADERADVAAVAQSVASAKTSSSHLAAANGSELSLQALAPMEAMRTLQPYILTADLADETRTHLLETGAAGLYRFDIAEQQTPLPPPLARADSWQDATAASVAAVDPSDVDASALAAANDDAMSAQTKRRLLKATNSLATTTATTTLSRAKSDILNGLDQSAIVYLSSKEEKRILRAAAAAAAAAKAEIEAAQQQQQQDFNTTQTHTERRRMAKMTRVADTVQPKTARARARARKTGSPEESTTPSPSATPSPLVQAVNANAPLTASATGAYAGYETVMCAFRVMSERAARTLYSTRSAEQESDGEREGAGSRRLIVEAVVRRDADSEENYVDFQGAESKLGGVER